MICPNCKGLLSKRFIDKTILEKCLSCNYENIIVRGSLKSKKINVVDNINKYIDKNNQKVIIILKLKKFRTENNFTQSALSNMLNISAQRYGAIERCENEIGISRLVELAMIYGLKVDDLLEVKVIPNEEYNELGTYVISQEINHKIPVLNKDLKLKEYIEQINEVKNKLENDRDNESLLEQLKKLKSDFNNYKKKNSALLINEDVIEYYRYQAFLNIYNK